MESGRSSRRPWAQARQPEGDSGEESKKERETGQGELGVLAARWARLSGDAAANYNEPMIRIYDEIVNFIASGTTPQGVIDFVPSQETREVVADLIRREKTTGLSADERSQLDHYLQVEHIMRMAKAKARSLCRDD